MPDAVRCAWVPEGDPLYVAYHDEEWGVPSRDERHLFEMLVLEGAQAGLSWSTILRKRDGYRKAFAGFDAAKVARFGPADVERLMADAGIVRNRLKIESAIANAKAVLEVGSLGDLVWSFVGPTVCYAFMQACGLVNDHTTNCFRFSPAPGTSRRRA